LTIIIADTTCGLPHIMLERRGITLIPQVVIFGEQSFHDDHEMDMAVFLGKLKASRELPKTAAPEPALYFPVFERAAKKGETVIVVAPTSKASGTVRSAQTAARDFPRLDVRVIDTLTVSCNLGTLVLLADDLAKQGSSADEIVSCLERMIPRGRIYFYVDTLEFLARGGRIGGAKAMLGELLQVKPILQVKDGQVEPFEQVRTRKRALNRLVEVVTEQLKSDSDAHLCVLQADAVQEAHALAANLMTRLSIPEPPIYELPPAIVVHAGPGTMGVGFFV